MSKFIKILLNGMLRILVKSDMIGLIRETVAHVEANMSEARGSEKFDYVKKRVRASYPRLKNSLINLAIEMMVSISVK